MWWKRKHGIDFYKCIAKANGERMTSGTTGDARRGRQEQIRIFYGWEVRRRIDRADREVDESFGGVKTRVDLGASDEIEDVKERAKTNKKTGGRGNRCGRK